MKSPEELMNEIQQARCIIRSNSDALLHHVLQMGVKEALKNGYIKLAFPAPPGFMIHFKAMKD